MINRAAAHRSPATGALSARTRRWAIGVAAVPRLLGLPTLTAHN